MESSPSESSENAEPFFNYLRLQGDVEQQAQKDVYTCMAIHDKYYALGTTSGKILLFNKDYKLFKPLSSHTGRVNAISIDKSGETIASAGDDGFVYVQSFYGKVLDSYNYSSAVRALALDTSSDDNSFVCGGLRGKLVSHKKGMFGRALNTVINEGEGPITCIASASPYVAWCNELGTKIYDVKSESKIAFIEKPVLSSEYADCKPRLLWYGNSRLCIGWGNALVTVQLSYRKDQAGSSLCYGEILSSLSMEYSLCGLGVFSEKEVIALCYYPPEEGVVEYPSVQVVALGTGEVVTEECVSIKGYEGYLPSDYHFFCDVTQPSSATRPLFLVTPKSIVSITARSTQDHLEWAVKQGSFEKALRIVRDPKNGFRADRILDVEEKHLDFLFSCGQFEQAASLCPTYLEKDSACWERWVAKFNGVHQLHVLLPFVPIAEPRLPLPIYTLILNYFLYNDVASFLQLLRTWPKPEGREGDLYDPKGLSQLLQKMKETNHDSAVVESLAELFAMTNQPKEAVLLYLDNHLQGITKSHVFEWLEEFELYPAVQDRILDLFPINPEACSTYLVNHLGDLPPDHVVRQLTSQPYYQHLYLLISLFLKRSSVFLTPRTILQTHFRIQSGELDLLLKFHSDNLLFFLQTSQEYDVPAALTKCLKCDPPCSREAVYLFSRLGDTSRALQMIVQDLEDVDMALEFVQKWKDRDLWNDLVHYSVAKPSFVGALLDRAGEYINAITLVSAIPDRTEIPHLKEKLEHVLDNYALELELREGCNTILTSDRAELYERLIKAKMMGIRMNPDDVCTICQQPLFQFKKATRTAPPPSVIAFHCSHLYHHSCLEHVCKRFDNSKDDEEVMLRCIRCESGESHLQGEVLQADAILDQEYTFEAVAESD